MPAFACHFDIFTPCVPADLSAVLLTWRDFTNARDVSALLLLISRHLQFFSVSVFICRLDSSWIGGPEHPSSRVPELTPIGLASSLTFEFEALASHSSAAFGADPIQDARNNVSNWPKRTLRDA
jgi:hypothetical protein